MTTALFERDGDTFHPSAAAVGPWDRRIVHGAAVAALFAGRLGAEGTTMGRLTVELLAPVPLGPLHLEVTAPAGGARVQRRDAVLRSGDRVVGSARSVLVRRGELDLPDAAVVHASPFDPASAPPLGEANRAAEEQVGYPNFDSQAVAVHHMRVEGDRRTHQWVRLVVPVVEGCAILGVEVAAVAADYGAAGVHRRLPYTMWSFRNCELTVHLAREPEPAWVGIRCEGVVQPVGAGFSSGDLFDERGRMGSSAAALVVERR
jgi:hypothetical protein